MNLKQYLSFLIVMSALSGCSLSEVHENGDKCPADSNGEISYIYSELTCTKDTASACSIVRDGSREVHDFSYNFEYKICPWQFPTCKKYTYQDKDYYACEEKSVTKKKCAEYEIGCSTEDGRLRCIDPFNNKTCGANSCDEEHNFGGQNCKLFNGECVETGHQTYACINIENQTLVCGMAEVDPSSRSTCGANDCGAEGGNYGAQACSDDEVCYYNGMQYECTRLDCDGNTCLWNESDGTPVCANLKTKCGSDCSNCEELHQNADCTNGVCTISECLDGEHPVFEANQIVKCEKNGVSACAAKSITRFDRVFNCEAEKDVNVIDVICNDQGACEVTKCETGFHLNSAKTACLADSLEVCTNPETGISTDCTIIENVEDVSCTSGKCVVNRCAQGYHINSDRTGCEKNSNTLCAAVDSNTPYSCMTAGVKDVSCSTGRCVVSACTSNSYHIKADRTACEENANNSCAKSTSSEPKDCTKTPAKVCTSGACVCSDSSKVLNYTGTACVIPECKGIPGVKVGIIGKDDNRNDICKATSCDSDYNLWSTWGICRPTSNCQNMGYKNAASKGVCYGCESSMCKSCSHSYCKSGYRHYHTACIPKDACCGKSSDSSVCKNCLALNKTCNVSTGKCE